MIWYLLNMALLTAIRLIPTASEGGQARFTDEVRRKAICAYGAVSWIVLSGLRGLGVGADTYQYGVMFEEVKLRSWDSVVSDLVQKVFYAGEAHDPGYPVLEKLFQVVCGDYRVFLIAVAAIFFLPLAMLIYRHSRFPYVSFILFDCLFYNFFAITGIRQTIATAIVVCIGMEFIYRRRLVPFLALIGVAYTVHASALCFLPFYALAYVRINKVTILFYISMIVGAFVFRYQVLELLHMMMGYEQYGDYEGAGAGTFMFLLIGIAVLAALFHRSIGREGDAFALMSMNALFISVGVASLLLINQSFMRLVQYYSLFLLFMVPELIFQLGGRLNAARPARARFAVGMLATMVLVALFVRTSPSYSFFFFD